MLSPSYLDVEPFWKPLRNTPPAVLTRDLPHDIKADLLLLGCGDVRNILFTLYSEHNRSRELDITCCDSNETVIARNIVLLSLLARSKDTDKQVLWNIYFHIQLDEQSRELLSEHAEFLLSVSTTLEAWNSSNVGKVLKFCDKSTFNRIRNLWKSYCEPKPVSKIQTQIALRKELRRAQDFRQRSILHPGTDPVLGFHLATATSPLKQDSVLFTESGHPDGTQRVIWAAHAQFSAWCKAYQHVSEKGLVVRFFAGDAIALAHSLHVAADLGTTRAGTPCNIYRDKYHFDVIQLDAEMYSKGAPVFFNVTDTSRLQDHFGTLLLLSALSPLLKDDAASSIHTDYIMRRAKESRHTHLRLMMCGDVNTAAVLLILYPVEYITNAPAMAPVDEAVPDRNNYIRVKLSWKRLPKLNNSEHGRGLKESKIQIGDTELADILYLVYGLLFGRKDSVTLRGRPKFRRTRPSSHSHHHRGAFVALVGLLRSRIIMENFALIMHQFMGMITNNTEFLGHLTYLEEMYTLFHVTGAYSHTLFTQPHEYAMTHTGRFADWQSLPQILCVTLQIPRKQLSTFISNMVDNTSAPLGHCTVESVTGNSGKPQEHTFSQFQMVFGNISTTGTRYSNDFAVHVAEDDLRWAGKSPLIVSFNVPAWDLSSEPQSAVLPLSGLLFNAIMPVLQYIISTKGVAMIDVDVEELRFWKKIVPVYTERCRDWIHDADCVYPDGSEQHDEDAAEMLCACGEGHFPENFMGEKNEEWWSEIKKFSTRAALAPLFEVPVVKADMRGGSMEKAWDMKRAGDEEKMEIDGDACVVCGREESPTGGNLLRCSACKEVKYCCVACQQADWKKHKRVCKKV